MTSKAPPELSGRVDDRQAALLAYVGQVSSDLASIARDCDQPILAYFLNLARAEALLHAERAPGAAFVLTTRRAEGS